MVNWSHWLDPPEGSEPPSRLILATAPVSAVWMRMRYDLIETRVERPLSLIRASRQCEDSTRRGITSFTSSNWSAVAELAVNWGMDISPLRGEFSTLKKNCCFAQESIQHSALSI